MKSNTELNNSSDQQQQGDTNKVTNEETSCSLSDGVLNQRSLDEAARPKEVPKKCEMEERRMEINRLRAKQIRKQKKQMEEDLQNEIIQLTLENNKLQTQLQIQKHEILFLRSQQQARKVSSYDVKFVFENGRTSTTGTLTLSFFLCVSYF